MSTSDNVASGMLYDKLLSYTSRGVYPMHMPGHKRNSGFFSGLPGSIDITEIDGFDNLADAHDVLRETSLVASGLYGSDKAFLLVNGSTAGVLSAIGALAHRGGKILLARNCHMSVHNAVALFGLIPKYIMPEIDGSTGIFRDISPCDVEKALKEEPDTLLVVITSPTYEGAVSDVGEIARVSHAYGVPLFVDCAHGAHFGFSPAFPESPVSAGADAVVMSLHKTLPALTQCSLLHVSGKLADAAKIAEMVNVFQTSSPSYVLLSSIDRCLRTLSTDSAQLFQNYEKNLSLFFAEASSMKNLRLLWSPELILNSGFYAYDRGKIVVLTGSAVNGGGKQEAAGHVIINDALRSERAGTGGAAASGLVLTGQALMSILRDKYSIELETAGPNYALAMTSVCDTAEGFRRFADALIDIDKNQDYFNKPDEYGSNSPAALYATRMLPRAVLTPSEALALSGKFFPLRESAGLISLEYVYAYPPGIPVVVPGEVINEAFIIHCTRITVAGVALKSTKGRFPDCIFAAPND